MDKAPGPAIEILHRDVLARITRTPWGTTPAMLPDDTLKGLAADSVLNLPGEAFLESPGIISPAGVSSFLASHPAYCAVGFFSGDEGATVCGDHPLVLLANASGHYANGTMPQALKSLRQAIGPERLIGVTGVATPQNLPLLAYMGTDVFDLSLLRMLTLRGWRFDGPLAMETKESGDAMLHHNASSFAGVLAQTREAIRRGHLRELAEACSAHSFKSTQLLSALDRTDWHEAMWPVDQRKFDSLGDRTLSRPDIRRHLSRMRDWYDPPKGRILLLLPCSARKPYSESKTHRAFIETLEHTGRRGAVHEVVVTSPAIVVPRELETYHPAVSYDIAVTGIWTPAEKELIRESLSVLVAKGQYTHIISHLPDNMGFVKDFVKVDANTVIGHPTSPESLAALSDKVKELATGPQPTRDTMMLDLLRGAASYQFGEGARPLFDGATPRRVHGQPALFKGENQLCILSPERGDVALTLDGARAMLDCGCLQVEIDDFKPKGDIFAVGVKGATPDVRTGDEVLVVHKGDLRGVGVAQVCASEMGRLRKGTAVKMRHRAK